MGAAGPTPFPTPLVRFFLDSKGAFFYSRALEFCPLSRTNLSLNVVFVSLTLFASLGIVPGTTPGVFGGFLKTAILQSINIMMSFPKIMA